MSDLLKTRAEKLFENLEKWLYIGLALRSFVGSGQKNLLEKV